MGVRLHSDANGADIYINGYAYARAKGGAGYLNVQHPFAVSNYFNLQSYGNIGNRIFQAPASGNHLVREVLVLNKGLGNSEREQLEGYLAWKWGFVDQLPQTHPYVQAPPSEWSPTALQANLLLWLDANRSATLFADTECSMGATGGQAIACWQDLSGHARHLMQGNALYRPLYTPSDASHAAGLPGVEVQPNQYLLTANGATWLNNTNFTLVTVQNRIYAEQGLNIGGYPNHSHAYTGAVIGVEPKLTDANAGYNPSTFLYFPHISLTQAGMIQGLPNELLNDYRYIPPVAIAESANDIIKYHPYFGYAGSLATRENATWLHQSPYLIATVVSLVGNLNHSSYNCLLGIVAPKSNLSLNSELELNAPKFADDSRGYYPPPENVAVNQSYNLVTRTNVSQPFEEKRLYVVWRAQSDQVPLISVNGDNAKNANFWYTPWGGSSPTRHGRDGFIKLVSNILSVFALGDCRTGMRNADGNPHGPVATMYETIVIAGNVRYGHQRLIEGYLAWKWGIEKKLPRSHPYYRVPPRKS